MRLPPCISLRLVKWLVLGRRSSSADRVCRQTDAVLLGANWNNASNSGSRASNWNNAPSNSNSNISARASCEYNECKIIRRFGYGLPGWLQSCGQLSVDLLREIQNPVRDSGA